MDINKFKQSNIFEKYESWIRGLIGNDYYSPESYDEDGNLISDEYFDEEGYDKEEAWILATSHQIYEEIRHDSIRKKYGTFDKVRIADDILSKYKSDISTGVIGTVYFMWVYDFPSYPRLLGGSWLFKRFYNELFTHLFAELDISNSPISIWLDLYASLRSITSVLGLPQCLQSPQAQTYLRDLQREGFLDDNFKFTGPAQKQVWERRIAYWLNIKLGCTYSDLEEHFNVKNLRDDRPWDSFLNSLSNNTVKPEEEDIHTTIEDIFS